MPPPTTAVSTRAPRRARSAEKCSAASHPAAPMFACRSTETVARSAGIPVRRHSSAISLVLVWCGANSSTSRAAARARYPDALAALLAAGKAAWR